MRIAYQLVVDKDLKASAYAGCFKIKSSLDLGRSKYDSRSVDTDLIVLIADRL